MATSSVAHRGPLTLSRSSSVWMRDVPMMTSTMITASADAIAHLVQVERVTVQHRREDLGGVGRAAARHDVDQVEHFEAADDREHRRDADDRLHQRHDHLEGQLAAVRTVAPRRLEHLAAAAPGGRPAGSPG